MNQAGVDLVKSFEGFRSQAYLDAVGVPTIGYGFTKGVQLGDLMTQDEADARLAQELGEFEAGVLKLCVRAPGANQAAAMSALAYNIGLAAFKGSSVLREHNDGFFALAADAFLLWNRAGGRVLPGLVKRRAAERKLYLTPDADAA